MLPGHIDRNNYCFPYKGVIKTIDYSDFDAFLKIIKTKKLDSGSYYHQVKEFRNFHKALATKCQLSSVVNASNVIGIGKNINFLKYLGVPGDVIRKNNYFENCYESYDKLLQTPPKYYEDNEAYKLGLTNEFYNDVKPFFQIFQNPTPIEAKDWVCKGVYVLFWKLMGSFLEFNQLMRQVDTRFVSTVNSCQVKCHKIIQEMKVLRSMIGNTIPGTRDVEVYMLKRTIIVKENEIKNLQCVVKGLLGKVKELKKKSASEMEPPYPVLMERYNKILLEQKSDINTLCELNAKYKNKKRDYLEAYHQVNLLESNIEIFEGEIAALKINLKETIKENNKLKTICKKNFSSEKQITEKNNVIKDLKNTLSLKDGTINELKIELVEQKETVTKLEAKLTQPIEINPEELVLSTNDLLIELSNLQGSNIDYKETISRAISLDGVFDPKKWVFHGIEYKFGDINVNQNTYHALHGSVDDPLKFDIVTWYVIADKFNDNDIRISILRKLGMRLQKKENKLLVARDRPLDLNETIGSNLYAKLTSHYCTLL